MKFDIPSVVTMFGLLPFLASSVSAQQKEPLDDKAVAAGLVRMGDHLSVLPLLK